MSLHKMRVAKLRQRLAKYWQRQTDRETETKLTMAIQ